MITSPINYVENKYHLQPKFNPGSKTKIEDEEMYADFIPNHERVKPRKTKSKDQYTELNKTIVANRVKKFKPS